MLRALQHLFHRPAIRLGVMDEPRGLCRNQRFASFLTASNRATIAPAFHFSLVRGRRLLRQILTVALAGSGAWILYESVRALSVF